MDINQVLTEYDGMFGTYSMEEIEEYLLNMLSAAEAEPDYFSAVTLMNELIGFYRDTNQREKGLHYCSLVIPAMEKLELCGSVEYATSLINLANAYRAFGLHQESEKLYEEVEMIYHGKMLAGEFHYASLYNNWSLLCQETEDFEGAKEKLLKAMAVVDLYKEAIIPQANTRTNLAVTLLRISQIPGKESAYEEAMAYLNEALAIFEADAGKDFHYSGALSAKGDALFMKKEYQEAASYYHRAMEELLKHVGRNQGYERVAENYRIAMKHIQKDYVNHIERCRDFYEIYGAPMIHEKFADYESRIAVGLVGEGSDCFGFEDTISTDHDFEVGFCMWLSKEDYDVIGASLNQAYEELVAVHRDEFWESEPLTEVNRFIDSRRGVFCISSFYENILGVTISDELMPEQLWGVRIWYGIEEHKLATATNGQVFRDDAGGFTKIREVLQAGYPERVWRLRLATALHDFSQYAQSNYARMMARKDIVTARMCVAKGMQSAMEIAYLLNKTYAPYYKWQRRGMEGLTLLQDVIPLLDEIARAELQTKAWEGISYRADMFNEKDSVLVLFEKTAGILLQEMKAQGLVKGEDTFLDIYVPVLSNMEECMRHDELVDAIVDLEWQQFDKVKNENGRADCQNDWNTFSIMRKSQYLTWPDELLKSFLQDLKEAEQNGWNLIMEKYARMMESTAPMRYAELAEELPVRDEERIAIQEEIIKIQVAWMEVFAVKYPKMAYNARSIHTKEDTAYNTSYETYLRGELGTYSADTLLLYGRFVVGLKQEERNLAYEIMENTAKLYGYANVEDAESRL